MSCPFSLLPFVSCKRREFYLRALQSVGCQYFVSVVTSAKSSSVLTFVLRSKRNCTRCILPECMFSIWSSNAAILRLLNFGVLLVQSMEPLYLATLLSQLTACIGYTLSCWSEWMTVMMNFDWSVLKHGCPTLSKCFAPSKVSCSAGWFVCFKCVMSIAVWQSVACYSFK